MPYPETTEKFMRRFFNTLSEKDKRRYAAIEAQKLEYGGISYIARVLGCSRTTIYEGLSELEALLDNSPDRRIRRPGGGRKPYEQRIEGIDEAFLDVLKNNIAGDPMNEHVRWTNLTQDEIGERMSDQHDIQVSTTVVRQLLAKHNFRQRKAQKNEP